MLNKETLHNHLMSRRIFLLGAGKLGLLSLLALRVGYIQLVKNDEYKTLSDKNRINFMAIKPVRGKIYDVDNTILATNLPCFQLLLDRSISRNYLKELEFISRILELSVEQQHHIKQKIKKSGQRTPIVILNQLNWRQLSLIEEQKYKLTSMFIDTGYTRFYPMPESVCHLLGYTGQMNEKERQELNIRNLSDLNIGKSGIEKYYEQTLRGEFGYKKIEVNAFGKQVREITNFSSVPGEDLYLNIDASLQEKIQAYLDKEGCSAIVMDTHNGNVLILASSPGFDLNNFSKLSRDYWTSLTNDPYKPLVNKTVQSLYPPGSVFKIITFLAALEAGIQPDKLVFCGGGPVLGGNHFRCWYHQGHGTLDMLGAIKRSCNSYIYEISRLIGSDRILEMAKRFGFGAKTGIDITGECAGFVPSQEWKKQKLGTKWSLGDTLNLAIGQGFLSVTPIQLARFITAVASHGKLYTPRIRKNEPEFYDINVSAPHLDVIKEGLYRVVNTVGGTSHSSALNLNHQLAGKTGTSQVQSKLNAQDDLSRKSIARKSRNHGLFLGFAPYHAPRYSVTIFVDHGGSGSGAAAPVAKKIMLDVLNKYCV